LVVDQQDNTPPEDFVDLPDGNEGNDHGENQGNYLGDTIAHQMWNEYQNHRN
jgi:hypothetical protein